MKACLYTPRPPFAVYYGKVVLVVDKEYSLETMYLVCADLQTGLVLLSL